MIENWKLIDHAVYIPNIDSVIISDIHLGKTYPNSSKMESDQIQKRLIDIITTTKCSKVLFNGDIFNYYPSKEHNVNLFKNIDEHVSELVFINGNHEVKVGGYPNAIQQNYSVMDEYTSSYVTANGKTVNLLIHHGHEIKDINTVDVEIIGHLHLQKDGESVYLWNPSRKPSRLILPAFSNLSTGFNLSQLTEQNKASILKDEEMDAYTKIRT